MHERQRQAASRNPFVRASIHELIAALERERSGIEAAPGWRDRLALVRVVPSVGPVTLLGFLNAVTKIGRGWAPRPIHESGDDG